MSHLRVALLGSFRVWRDERLLDPRAWPGHKERQLLKILVTHRQRTVSSDELIEWLWPDLAPDSARNCLWATMSRLRRVLEPEAGARGSYRFILTERPGYRFALAGDCELDVDRFLQQIHEGQVLQNQGDWAAALAAYGAAEALYRGDYLAEDPYEEWATWERERWRSTFFEVEIELARCHLARRATHEALTRCRRVLDHDDCNESAWRLVMECHYLAGEQGQAAQAFERCRTALARELGMDPSSETVALYERILRGRRDGEGREEPEPMRPGPLVTPPAPFPGHVSSRLPLVGREKEWSALSRLLQEAMSGQGKVVLLAGEPGIGKTRLLQEIGHLAELKGFRVLSARCHELEQNVAYVPVTDAMRSALRVEPSTFSHLSPALLSAIAELLPELREVHRDLPPYQPLPPDEERLRLLTALTQAVGGRTGDRPRLFMLDDLHWTDPSTLQLVHHLARQIHSLPLLLLAAYRTTAEDFQHPISAFRSALLSQGVLTELVLSPFSEEDTILLFRALGQEAWVCDLARRLHQDTRGNPLFLTEMLCTFVQEGLTFVDGAGRWRRERDEAVYTYEELLLPPSVRAAVLDRLNRLATDDRTVLNSASVVGRAFSPPLMAALVGGSEPLLIERLDGLVARGFLHLTPEGHYDFAHDLMRRVACDALSEPRRRILHRQVAEAILAVDARSPGELAGPLATHFAAGDRPWLALDYALTASEKAAKIAAYDEATAWCERALRLVADHPASVPKGYRTRLQLQRRTLCYYQGDLTCTLEADRAALAAARQEKDVAAELQALWYLAHDSTQVTAATGPEIQEQALRLAQEVGDQAALARSLARLGSDVGFRASPQERERALEYLEQSIALARTVGDAMLLHEVLTEAWGVGRIPGARLALEEALALVRDVGDLHEEVGTLAKLADVLVRQGDFVAAARHAGQGMVLASQAHSPPYRAWNQRALGQAMAALGQAADGLRHLGEAAATLEEHGWQAMLTGTLLRRGLALLAVGDRERAAPVLERVVQLTEETREPYEAAYALAALGALHLQRKDLSVGRKLLAEASAVAQQVGLPWHRGGTWNQVATGWLLAGEAEAALAAANLALQVVEKEDLREVRAHALGLRGLALKALGRPREAKDALTEGLHGAVAMGHVWLRGWLQSALRQPAHKGKVARSVRVALEEARAALQSGAEGPQGPGTAPSSPPPHSDD